MLLPVASILTFFVFVLLFGSRILEPAHSLLLATATDIVNYCSLLLGRNDLAFKQTFANLPVSRMFHISDCRFQNALA